MTAARAGGETWAWHFTGGVFWGAFLGAAAIWLNQNYDALFHGPGEVPPAAMIALVVFLVSLPLIALFFVVGLVRALGGRPDRRRWALLGGIVVGFGIGGAIF